MKRIFTAAIAIAAIALAGSMPARAITFPSLTQIYFASGALDDNPTNPIGTATVINCTNMSGQTASVRYQFRAAEGVPLAGGTLLIPNLVTQVVSSAGPVDLVVARQLPTGVFRNAAIQILSTQSAVYCSAMLIYAGASAAGVGPQGVALHMVRFNPHPGTVE